MLNSVKETSNLARQMENYPSHVSIWQKASRIVSLEGGAKTWKRTGWTITFNCTSLICSFSRSHCYSLQESSISWSPFAIQTLYWDRQSEISQPDCQVIAKILNLYRNSMLVRVSQNWKWCAARVWGLCRTLTLFALIPPSPRSTRRIWCAHCYKTPSMCFVPSVERPTIWADLCPLGLPAPAPSALMGVLSLSLIDPNWTI